jgi:hypothetical protein
MTKGARNQTVYLTASALVLAAACSVFVSPTRDTIVYSHRSHVQQGMTCDNCHGEINEDAEKEVKAIPGKPQCAECHDVKDKNKCRTCHTNPQKPAVWDRPESAHLYFSHEVHKKRVKGCDDCHKEVSRSVEISAKHRALPQHTECNVCHRKDFDQGRCRLCHERLDLYPRKPETLYSHRDGFFQVHGKQAAAGGEEHCATCHDQSYCADCHARTLTVRPSLRWPEKVDRNFIHRGDWISRHALESRTGDPSCLKCHGRTFCSSCHERSGVGFYVNSRVLSEKRNQHPAGWQTLHGREARRRITECASCHDQGPLSNCAAAGCHRTGGINPHPPGWHSPADGAQRTTNKMCSICHTR